MRLLITGLNGFVAGSIVAHARKNWEVHGIHHSEPAGFPGDVYAHKADLTDKEKVATLFQLIKPSAVIHAAAIANIDFCEKNQERARNINVGITETIAELCKNVDAKLIFCSSDTVFDGIKGYYAEEDAPNAVNYYAETKIEAERVVLAASSKNIVARLSLVMGLPVYGKGNSFLVDLIDKLVKGESIKFPENEIRTPIDVVTLGSALTELAGCSYGGILHLAGNTRINRYQMALAIAEKMGFNLDLIEATDSNSMADRAPRPNDASLDNVLAKKILKTPMRSLAEGLDLTLNFKNRGVR